MDTLSPPSPEMQPHDAAPPGGVYLCQVSETVSCGACCGLYNRHRRSRREVSAFLARRTEIFSRLPRTVTAIDAFRRRIESEEGNRPPLPGFHHCPFLGLVGPRCSRVGCLLHPLAENNGGVDWRGLSDYGGLACRSYFCPTHDRLGAAHRDIVRNLFGHWYDYGLVVTEWRLIELLFAELERRCRHPLRWPDIAGDARFRQSLADLLGMKTDWPFRADPSGPLVHYFFHDGLYPKPEIDCAALGVRDSRYDALLSELGSAFADAGRLQEAEAMVERLLERCRRRFVESRPAPW